MTELKTLKEFEIDFMRLSPQLYKNIKAEAVKWIIYLADSEEKEDRGAISFIKRFFNLSDKDLEGEMGK